MVVNGTSTGPAPTRTAGPRARGAPAPRGGGKKGGGPAQPVRSRDKSNVPFQFRGRLFCLLINMMRAHVPNHSQLPRLLRPRTCGSAEADPAGCAARGEGRVVVGRPEQQPRVPRGPGRYVLPAVWPSPSSPAPVEAGASLRGCPTHSPLRPPGPGEPEAHRLRPLPREPACCRRHCRPPRWMGQPPAQGLASWPPVPARLGCAGRGYGGAGLHTAGPCPWSWPGEAGGCEVPVAHWSRGPCMGHKLPGAS